MTQDWLFQRIVLLSRDLNKPFNITRQRTPPGPFPRRGNHYLLHHHHRHTDSGDPRRCVDESGYLRQRRKQFTFTLSGARPERRSATDWQIIWDYSLVNEASYNVTGRRTSPRWTRRLFEEDGGWPRARTSEERVSLNSSCRYVKTLLNL